MSRLSPSNQPLRFRPSTGRGSISRRLHPAACALLLLLLCVSGQAFAQFSGPTAPLSASFNQPIEPTTDLAILYPAAREIHLDNGDLLSIRIFGTNEYAPPARVALDGSIQLPFIGVLQVQGLTLHETEQLIASRLVQAGMYRDPQVSVQLTESPNQVVTITGEMHAIVPVLGTRKLYDVLGAATGNNPFPVTASRLITIDRPGVDQPIVVDLGNDPLHSAHADIPIFAHDTIVISRVGVVYTIGGFHTQGAIPLQKNSPLTLMQAVALGGGTNFDAKYNDLRIIRTNGTSRSVIRVDYKKILRGHEPDPILQADDIVYMPNSLLKAATTVGGIGTLLGIASILIYTFHP